MNIDELTYQIRGAIFAVYNELGPGLLESYYERALCYELGDRGISIQSQIPVKASYKGRTMDLGFRIDVLADDQVIIEIKSVELLHDVHKKQLLTYLKIAKKKIGILINFNVTRVEDKISLIRIINFLSLLICAIRATCRLAGRRSLREIAMHSSPLHHQLSSRLNLARV